MFCNGRSFESTVNGYKVEIRNECQLLNLNHKLNPLLVRKLEIFLCHFLTLDLEMNKKHPANKSPEKKN